MTTVHQHPDYNEENQRLEYTKRYMEAVIKTAETSKDNFQDNMKAAFKDVDSSLGYSSLLTNARFFDMSKEELSSLKKSRLKPYFARIDFSRDDQPAEEVIYIGKTSLYSRENQDQLIVDWRSPIANLYYEGRLGDVSYVSNGENFNGELLLKRQFMMERGLLTEIRDIDLTTNDQLLQETLAGSASNRLTEIVSTIQEEQNKVIRADLNKPIIVQGGAGSGKTTIALHRISYFIFQYKENFQPEQLMIIAPSNLFLDYISEALPELGVENIKQKTYEDYVIGALQKENIKLKKDDKLIQLLEKNHQKETVHALQISKLKGSKVFQTILNEYMKEIFLTFHPPTDFYVDKYRLYKSARFVQLLEEDFYYLPLYKRINKLRSILQNEIKHKKKKMLEKIEMFYDDKIERALYQAKDPVKRKKYVSQALDKKEARLNEMKTAIKTSVATYMKQFPKKNIWSYYKDLFQNPQQLVKRSHNQLTQVEAENIIRYQQDLFKRRMYEREDLALLLYLQVHLFGIEKEWKVKNIVIDEAQDYTFMELLSLKKAADTDMFTLVGDLAQGIHSYRGLTSWEDVKAEIFPRATYTELQKSYRTTVEIMEAANHILKKLPYTFPEVKPVVRHGEHPQFIPSPEGKHYINVLEAKLLKVKEEGFKTFALIGKTMNDCMKLYQQFEKTGDMVVYLLGEHGQIPKESVVIVPAYLAKGLEFDVVFIFSIDEVFTSKAPLEIQLLYVAMTRPLHRLYFYGNKKTDFLLEEDEGW
ncbi:MULTISPECIES: HelD family protein [Cytobacillus]|uniref:DNA helicase n=1 Tax=Cytobacillus kochii TaxID=859143 RepID=A0A248TDX5_9BACI|nr:UvrD-helicase domain-containing protein [Cytobacillus kochii]ASV66387.1 DNA helicase [Cytobacillus kochii]MDQ0187415.1 DNA helicase-2/ATP-dependent DNA helicase PcrA [Cytobacillus kochii]